MRILAYVLIFLSCLLFHCPLALAGNPRLYFQATEQLTDEQWRILLWVRRLDKTVNAELHQRFWSLFSEEERRNWLAAEGSERSVAARILLYERIEEAFARSIYESHMAGTTVRIPELDELRAKAPASKFDEQDPWTQLFKRQDSWLDLDRLRNSKLISRYPLRAFAKMNEAQLALRQTEMLLRSDWDGQPATWSYPPMDLKITWAYPWHVNQAVLCDADCRFWSIRPFVAESSTAAIYFIDRLSAGFDPLGSKEFRSGINIFSDAGMPFNVLEQRRQDFNWQGRRSVTFISTMSSYNGDPLYGISRIVFNHESSSILIFTARSSLSVDDAQRQFDEMTSAVMLY